MRNLLTTFGFATFVLVAAVSFAPEAFSQTQIRLEGDLSWQSRNDQRVPGSSGTLFSLSDIKQGPFPNFRVYAGHRFQKRHEIRFLYAPLQIELDTQFSSPVSFLGATFAAGTPTTALYKFNSYRATYAYHFDNAGNWRYALGFTAKVRDAEVRLTQGALKQSKANIGFVPLLNFQLEYDFGGGWLARIDADGLAAPQGRAFDIGLFAERRIGEAFSVFAGYRTIEGGADNAEVYNFAWIHKLVFGAGASF